MFKVMRRVGGHGLQTMMPRLVIHVWQRLIVFIEETWSGTLSWVLRIVCAPTDGTYLPNPFESHPSQFSRFRLQFSSGLMRYVSAFGNVHNRLEATQEFSSQLV